MYCEVKVYLQLHVFLTLVPNAPPRHSLGYRAVLNNVGKGKLPAPAGNQATIIKSTTSRGKVLEFLDFIKKLKNPNCYTPEFNSPTGLSRDW
jgi:hypothetical protein